MYRIKVVMVLCFWWVINVICKGIGKCQYSKGQVKLNSWEYHILKYLRRPVRIFNCCLII